MGTSRRREANTLEWPLRGNLPQTWLLRGDLLGEDLLGEDLLGEDVLGEDLLHIDQNESRELASGVV